MNKIIAQHTAISEHQVAAVIRLLEEKATIPFIARYRKERTGSLDEVQVASIANEWERMKELEDRRKTILKTIDEQGKLTAELRAHIEACWDPTLLEDLYLPYKPHRKTRADIAIEQGMQPLATQLLRQDNSRFDTDETHLSMARDIIAEWISQDERTRAAVRREFNYTATIRTKQKPTPKNLSAQETAAWEQDLLKYKDYLSVDEPLKRISSHRLLAIRRAEAEGFIRVDISANEENCLDKIAAIWLKNRSDAAYQVELAMDDSYKRLLKPSIENEFAQQSKEKADTEAIRIFADNLRQLLLASPLGQKRVLSLDPGFRTGCKTVILSQQGDLLHHTVIYLHQPQQAQTTLQDLAQRFGIEAVAIGNGTASRETEALARTALTDMPIFVVSESGASVYSASKIARDEFPNEDVTVRGAVSIGRRLMDPLAELVKIEPKAIGVGQYQHDVDQKRLQDSLNQTVESVVNYVGVDVNTASPHLLTYISGLGPVLAQNIVQYRQENGPFRNRKELLKVPKMGAKTFELAAGFLRITDGDNCLDNSAVHPESYAIVEKMAKDLHTNVAELMQQRPLREQIVLSQYVTDTIGMPTLQDILHELDKPTRDPRQKAEEFRFSDEVHTVDDLKEGMILPGIVTNISAFGAFVDLGIHKDGLIHISQMSNRRISSPAEVLSLHQQIRVRVLEVDRARGRISLSIKDI